MFRTEKRKKKPVIEVTLRIPRGKKRTKIKKPSCSGILVIATTTTTGCIIHVDIKWKQEPVKHGFEKKSMTTMSLGGDNWTVLPQFPHRDGFLFGNRAAGWLSVGM